MLKVNMFVKENDYGELYGEWWYDTEDGRQYGSDINITFVKSGRIWDKYEYTHGGNIYKAVVDAVYDYGKPLKPNQTIELEV